MEDFTTHSPRVCKYCNQPTHSHALTCRFLRLPVETRFWMRVQKSDGCWEWTGHKNHAGYGMMRMGGKPRHMHRFSWEMHHGPIPPNMEVCHRCDNPACIRPDHLWLGTHAENMHDAFLKGRSSMKRCPERASRGDGHWTRKDSTKVRGENNAQSKLTELQVREIRTLREQGMELQPIADRFGVTKQIIWAIVHRKSWSHVE